MRSSNKRLLWIGSAILVVFLLFFGHGFLARYDYSVAIAEILDRAEPENRHPPASVKSMLLADKGIEEVVGYVSQRLLAESYPTPRDLPIGRPVDHALVVGILRLRYSDDVLVAIYCTIAWNGQDEGLVELSRRLYSRLPSMLDPQELAFALAVLEAPSALDNDPHRLSRIADKYSNRLAQ